MPPRGYPIHLPEYRGLLNRLWSDPIKRLGLAISGGVDSMALAHLTRKLADEKQRLYGDKNTLRVHAFIVDHAARPSSSAEAAAIAQVLKGYGFTAHVIPLQWRPGEVGAAGFETRARTARYRALARACVRAGVYRLLLAHHADDQAETVMMRLISGSRLDGLAGMKAVATIPESGDVWGAKKVTVARPFLEVGKERLRATCEHNSVQWFEDATNEDATYTRRNAVRQLLGADPPRLPKALQRHSLVAISKRAEIRNQTVKEVALRLLRDHCQIDINPRTGTLNLTLPRDRSVIWRDVGNQVLMRLLIEVAEMNSPSSRVETRHMLTAFEKVFSAGEEDEIKKFTSAGLAWVYEGKQKWTLNREPFYTRSRGEVMQIRAGEGWSDWRLWDGRWWIRVQTPEGVKGSFVRVLWEDDMKNVKAKAVKRKKNKELKDSLAELKMGLRFTVPALFWRRYGEGGVEEEALVALPTMGLDFEDDAKYEVKFKI